MATDPQKVVVLGDSGVGKTALVRRFVSGDFSGESSRTKPAPATADYALASTKKLQIGGRTVALSVWDTAGEERYRSLTPMYYKHAKAVLIVYDVTERESLARAETWVKELKVYGLDVPIVIAGNKSDLVSRKAGGVDPLEGKAMADKVGASHFLVSARTGNGVTDVFVTLAKRIVGEKSGPDSSSRKAAGGRQQRTIRISEEQSAPSVTQKPADKPCCVVS
ncbi:Ras-related protein Rab-21 [Diplonema papillatum]|nr:Ras-related protein Rab-21 [Diplonema papillatum]